MTVVRTFSIFILHLNGEFSTGNAVSGFDGVPTMPKQSVEWLRALAGKYRHDDGH